VGGTGFDGIYLFLCTLLLIVQKLPCGWMWVYFIFIFLVFDSRPPRSSLGGLHDCALYYYNICELPFMFLLYNLYIQFIRFFC
jgi:hypothetical protein